MVTFFLRWSNKPYLGVETHLESNLYAWNESSEECKYYLWRELSRKIQLRQQRNICKYQAWGLSTECSNSASPWPVTLVLILPNSPQFFRTQKPLCVCVCVSARACRGKREKEKVGKRERGWIAEHSKNSSWNWQIRPFKYKEKLEC